MALALVAVAAGGEVAANASNFDTFVQYGMMRTASTFQFMTVCLLAHVNYGLGRAGGYRRRVKCLFKADVTARHLSEPHETREGETVVYVIKTHLINGVGSHNGKSVQLPVEAPLGPVPPTLLFLSTKEDDGGARELEAVAPLPPNTTLGVVQTYPEFVNLGLATLGRYGAVFPDVSAEELRAVREYLRYWEILRTCCGPQASVSHRNVLHGIKAGRASAALDSPHCEIYDLDAVEEALFNTSLWRAHFDLAKHDFLHAKDMDVKRGICCHSAVSTHNGNDFRGTWRPSKTVTEWLKRRGDPRDHKIDPVEACHHRNYASANADPVVCQDASGMRNGKGCPGDRHQQLRKPNYY